jgi:hypothetical protein
MTVWYRYFHKGKLILKIPLRGENPQDVELLVKWLSREKG